MYNNILRRNRDFMEAVSREIAACGSKLELKTIMTRAINGGAPAFYLEFETALPQIRRIHRGEMPSGRRKQQWAELYSLVVNEMKSTGCDLFEATDRVLSTRPASSFFIGIKTALAIYHEYRRFKSFANR